MHLTTGNDWGALVTVVLTPQPVADTSEATELADDSALLATELDTLLTLEAGELALDARLLESDDWLLLKDDALDTELLDSDARLELDTLLTELALDVGVLLDVLLGGVDELEPPPPPHPASTRASRLAETIR